MVDQEHGSMDDIKEITDVDLMVDIEMAQALAACTKLEAEAELAKVILEKEKGEYLKERINLDYQLGGTYTFHRDVSQKSMDKLFKHILVWHRHDPQAPWTIYLNSVGGEVYAGNGIIDELSAHSLQGGGTHHLTIKVRGVAGSMAGMILQAADDRVVGLNALMMIHKGVVCMAGRVEDVADEAEWQRRAVDAMIALFLSRTDKITRPDFLKRINRKDWWINSSEAVEKYGFADRIG